MSLVKYSADEDGVTTRTTGTMMFGEKHNSNFRAVYEESDGLMMEYTMQWHSMAREKSIAIESRM